MVRVFIVVPALRIAATSASAFVTPAANRAVSSPAFTRVAERLSVLQRFPARVANHRGAAISMAKEVENNGDDENKEEENAEKDEPVERQTKRAMRQLAAFQATLRQRLVKAKQRLDDDFTATSTDDILAKLGEAIRLIDLHDTPATNSDESHLVEYDIKVAEEEQDMPSALTDIQTLIDESHQCIEIKNSLQTGIVKPTFHTLFLPQTFLTNRRCWTRVTVGQVDDNDERPLALDDFGENWNDVVVTVDKADDEGRKLKLDHYGRNLPDVVVKNKNGHERGARSIIDRGLGGTWRFDLKQTAFAVNLVNADAEMLGEDIECTTFPVPPPVTIDPKDESYLLTRSESRGIVADTFHKFAKDCKGGSVAAITGSPGIGKSWTLYYALQQALQYDGATVMFFFQKSDDVVMYLRRNHKIYAWYSKSRDSASSSLFKRSDLFVLLDPKEAKEGGARFSISRENVLYAASNNEGHFRNSAEKVNGNIRVYLGPPNDSELYVILAKLHPKLTRFEIETRKKNIGNLIRYILDKRKYDLRIQAIKRAVDECARDGVTLEKALDKNGTSNSELTMAGTLFYVLPRRPDDQTLIGYDGQNIMYSKRVVLAANDQVRKAIIKAGRTVILAYQAKVGAAEYANMEELIIED